MSVSDKASFLFRHTSLNGDRVYDEGHMIEREREMKRWGPGWQEDEAVKDSTEQICRRLAIS
jgi:hypothetical protein